jgi:bacterial/archaeal transporter family protein
MWGRWSLTFVAPIDKFGVVFAIILAVVFLGEAITLKLAVGGILIVLGVLVLAWA